MSTVDSHTKFASGQIRQPFQPNLIFASKATANPSGAPSSCAPLGLTLKYQTSPENLATNKNSNHRCLSNLFVFLAPGTKKISFITEIDLHTTCD
jgi:hypothetical protein